MMHPESKSAFDVGDQIVAFKKAMAPRREALKRAYGEVKDAVSRAADAIRSDTEAGRPTIPPCRCTTPSRTPTAS